jgi:hypothetical protein
MGWRYLMFTLGAITLFIFFLRFVVFNFKESPKFLVYRGKDAKAIEVLQHIAKVNKRECGVTLQDFEALTDVDESTRSGTELFGTGDQQRSLSSMQKLKLGFKRYGLLFKSWQIARLTLLVWLIYICDFWGFSLAGESHLFHLHVSRTIPLIITSLQATIFRRFSPRRTVNSGCLSEQPIVTTWPSTRLA